MLSKRQDMRSRTEYEGALDVDERLVTDSIDACRKVAGKSKGLPAIRKRRRRRRLGTSSAQLYRLLDQTNHGGSAEDRLVTILGQRRSAVPGAGRRACAE